MFCIHLLKGSEEKIFQSLFLNKYGIEQQLPVPLLFTDRRSEGEQKYALKHYNTGRLMN